MLTVLSEPYLLTAAGDVLRTFDVSELDEPQLLSQIDGHSHDITAIRLWIRKMVDDDGKRRGEPWIITTSLDKTIRKWKLAGRLFFALFFLYLMFTRFFQTYCSLRRRLRRHQKLKKLSQRRICRHSRKKRNENWQS